MVNCYLIILLLEGIVNKFDGFKYLVYVVGLGDKDWIEILGLGVIWYVLLEEF